MKASSHYPMPSEEPKASVLLVDDNPANLISLRAILECADYDLVEAQSGEEALERLTSEEFAVVLLDVRMPGMSGFDVATQIRADDRSQYTPIIFLTADEIDRSQTEKGYALGAVDFFVKPLAPVVVRAKVRGFVRLFDEKRKARHEADQLRLLVQGTKDYAIFMLDPDGRVLTWNSGAERFKGYKATEIIGRHFSQFYPQDAVDRGWPAHELAVATAEGRFEDEGWRVRKDGSRFWANVVITALRDEQGQLRGFSKVTRDLTERKNAEESLRRSEERFRLLIEGVQDYAIFLLDPQGNVATWNAGAERIKQYKADEIIGQHFSKFYPQEALDRGWPAHELMVATKEGRFEDEGWRVRKDGSLFWANVVISALRNHDGHLHGFTKVTRDLTARKQAEEGLRRSEERFRLLVEGATDYAIFLLDPQGNIVSWNPGAERIKQYDAGEIIGQHFSKFYPQEALDRGWPAHELTVAAAEGRFEDEGWRIRKDGTQFWANVVITALRDDGGKLLGFSKITRDMTERKRAEENARRLVEEATARRLAEENARLMQEQRERLHVTLASIGDAVISTDADGRVGFLNPVAEELVGWKSEEAVGRSLAEVFHIVNEDTRRPVENPALRALREGVTVGLANHTVLISKRGTEKPIDDSAAPIRDSDGNVVGSVLVFRDISERKLHEVALRSSEERLRLALDAGRMGVWDWNVRTGALTWSDSLEPLHGLAPGTFGGTFEHFQQLIHPEDREAVSTAIQQALESGGDFYVEFRNLRQNGGIHWIAGSGKVFPGEDDKALRLIGIGMDVTQRKRAEQTARFLAGASAALAVLVDFDSTLQKVASLAVPSFADWVTVDLAEADGSLRRVSVSHIDPAKVQLAHEVHRRFPPNPAAAQGVWKILRTGESEIVPELTEDLLVKSVQNHELLGILRELGLRSYIGVPLTVRGKTLGVITFIIAESGQQYDDTDLAVAEDLASRVAIAIENAMLYRELKAADQRKDEFLATLAHELRNPLAPIRNGLQVLRLAGGSGKVVEEARSMMERQLGQMVRLVDDLLDVSRITRNNLELRKERVTLAAVIHSAVETSSPLIEQWGHTFSLTLPPQPIDLDADLTRLAQVFSNLLNNSAKYTEPGGLISLTGEAVGGQVLVRVRDNGLGIPADALPRIFEMFAQADRNMERAQGGLGIGLTLVRRLVEMHGGTIEAHSDGSGRGSEFTVRLPILTGLRQRSEKSDSGSVAAAGPTRRILIVDDNQDSAMSLAMMLKLMGNEIRTAHDGLTAVEVAGQFQPDLILLDIGLPKLNGYDACRRIREQSWSKDVVIVALTGWGQDDDRRRSRQAGFDHHLVKPVDAAELNRLLAEKKH